MAENLQGREKKRRWGAERRLEFVEFLLFWQGGVNRSDLTERFGVSVPQASNDLTTYRELAPTNLQYDSSGKRYVASTEFKPQIHKPNPDRYLAQLKAISDGILDVADTWIGEAPPTSPLPIPSRRIDPEILRKLLTVVRERRAIRVHYQSMNLRNPKPLWRWITPHAFGFDGFRWHARAFCHRNNRFQDFVLGRCLDAGETGDAGAEPNADWEWQTFFDVVLKPNAKLAEGQRRAITLDYAMVSGKAVVAVRYALLNYFVRLLRLDAAAPSADPYQHPIVVANRDEFDQALTRIEADSDRSDHDRSAAARAVHRSA